MPPNFEGIAPTRPAGHATPADLAACRMLLRDGSRSFLAASHLLPARVRDPAVALYAFCRLADDAIDATRDDAALAVLHDRLDRAYAGRPAPIAADRAFADVVRDFAVPRALPAALLEGFAWDADGRRYPDLAALHEYGLRVAGSVGMMMALLMGARDPASLARAADLGVAMQLSNIARDVGEDARAGRLYLPLAWLTDEGIDPDAWLARPVFTPALGAVVRRLLTEAARLYAAADAGIAALPRTCRPGIAAARLLYAAIGEKVLHRGGDSVSSRAVVPPGRKLLLLLRAAAAAVAPPPATVAPPLPAARPLIAAAAASAACAPPPRSLEERLLWIAALFARLDERAGAGAGH
jgi:phytoene synthase